MPPVAHDPASGEHRVAHRRPARPEDRRVEPEVVDRSDSMNAVVLDLKNRVLHSAMGTVPATNSPFIATGLAQ